MGFIAEHAVEHPEISPEILEKIFAIAEWLKPTCDTIVFREFGVYDKRNSFIVDDMEWEFTWWYIPAERAELVGEFRPALVFYHPPLGPYCGHKSTKVFLR